MEKGLIKRLLLLLAYDYTHFSSMQHRVNNPYSQQVGDSFFRRFYTNQRLKRSRDWGEGEKDNFISTLTCTLHSNVRHVKIPFYTCVLGDLGPYSRKPIVLLRNNT